jgi:hypothetical protein
MAFEKNDPRINRRGRPRKGAALTDILNYMLDQKDEIGKLRREAVAEKLITLALAGDVPALRYLVDRLDGKPTATLALESGTLEIKLLEILK